MHVEIEHLEKPGMFFARSNWLRVKIELSKEEHAAASKQRLLHKVLLAADRRSEQDYEFTTDRQWSEQFTLATFISSRGFLFWFNTLTEAKNYARDLRPKLKNLKSVLETGLPRKETFDI